VSFLRRLSLFAATITALPFISTAAEPPSKPSQEQITQWVRQLGDDDFSVREAASKKLYEAGQAVEGALLEATGSQDAEVARRAGEIMDKFKWGLYPEAPKEVVDLVTRYRSSTPQGKHEVIRELLKAGPASARTLLKIVRAEEDPATRSGLFDLIQGELSLKVPELIAGEKYNALEPLIDVLVAANVERGAGYDAAYWQMRGKLDERIAQLKKTTGKGPEGKRTWEIVARLYYAKGDLAAARDAAEKADKPALVDSLLLEAGDWKELVKHTALNDAEPGAENLAYRATYQRLAGDAKGFEEALAELRKLGGAGPIAGYENLYLAKVLFLNDRPAEAVDIIARTPNSAVMAFEVLAAQTKYQEAMDLADKARKDGSAEADVLEILKARTLYLLGEKEKAAAIFARYGGMIDGKLDAPWIETLIESEVRVGLMDQATEQAAKALGKASYDAMRTRLLPKLFPKNGETSEVLWLVLHGLVGDVGVNVRMEASEAMRRLRDHLAGKATAQETADLLTQGEKDISRLTPDMVPKWRLALAEAALIAKNEPQARSLLEKAGSATALIRLGDLDTENKEWDKAAEHYSQAWTKEPTNPLPLYLNGRALVQAGQEKEGMKQIDQAHWLPLGDGLARFAFLKSLLERGQQDAAEREGELMLRLDPPGSQIASEGMRQVALAAMRRKDYLAAAQGQERSMLVCLKSSVGYARPAAYLWVPALVHRLRAEGYVAAGKFDEARRETDLCWAALPGDAFVPTEVVPMYDKAGRKKEATELFEKYLKVQEKLCETYPNYSSGHNAVAWLSACCHRNLESAEVHARKAVELSPDNAGVLDTLAEVQFQRGHKDEAIATQKKAVALEPKRAYFRKQLKRIKAGDPAADRPSENDDDDD
jgi:predicted Zn-dependent protease